MPKSPYMTNDFKKEVARYALYDAKATFMLWKEHGHKMPDHEWRISKMTREMGMRGVPVNMEKLKAAEAKLIEEKRRTEALLPWIGGEYPPLSLQAIRDQCDKEGIRKPKSFAEKDPEGAAWEAEFADRFPWVRAVRDYRKANKHLKTVQAMIARTRPDGRMGYELKFFGATTGRDSGGGGWNAQNIPKGEVAGVDIRNLIEAPEGKTLVICDLAQIEARCLPYLAKDFDLLKLIASGIDIYEAHARLTMGYNDPRPLKDVDPKMRQMAKVRCLAGTTPILTDRGYFSIAELQSLPCFRLWDGNNWVEYDAVITTGRRHVQNYQGEHFTADHKIFTENGEARPIREILEGSQSQPLRRNTPHKGWAEVWLLARFVTRTLAKEWLSSCRSPLRRLWEEIRSIVGQSKKGDHKSLRPLRDEKGEANKGLCRMGTELGRYGPRSESAVGCHDAEVLRPVKQRVQTIRGARSESSSGVSQ